MSIPLIGCLEHSIFIYLDLIFMFSKLSQCSLNSVSQHSLSTLLALTQRLNPLRTLLSISQHSPDSLNSFPANKYLQTRIHLKYRLCLVVVSSLHCHPPVVAEHHCVRQQCDAGQGLHLPSLDPRVLPRPLPPRGRGHVNRGQLYNHSIFTS